MDGTLRKHIELSPLTEETPLQEEDSWEVFSEEDGEEDFEQDNRDEVLRYSKRKFTTLP